MPGRAARKRDTLCAIPFAGLRAVRGGMSDNPYTPPSAQLAGHVVSAGQAGTGSFDVGRCLSDAWANTWENFPLWLGAGLVWGLALVASMVTVIGLVLLPALAWGGTQFWLKMHDGGAEFSDIFSGFSRFGEAFRPMAVLMAVLFALSILGASAQFAGAASESSLLTALGYLVSFAFNLLVMPRLTFAVFYVVDQGLSGTDALKRAWADTEASKWKVVLLALLAYPMMIAGALALLIGMIPAMVIWYLTYVSAYRQIAGKPGVA